MNSLIHRIQQNNEAAFEEIYHSFHQKAYGFALRYTKNPSSAKEITQQFFIKIWMNKHKLSAEKPLEGQLFMILRNLVIDEMRKITHRKKFTEQVASQIEISIRPTEESILLNDLKGQLNVAIESLPNRRKKIFQLSREEGLSYREIAERLTISTKTVEAQMSLALKTLRVKLNAFLHLFL